MRNASREVKNLLTTTRSRAIYSRPLRTGNDTDFVNKYTILSFVNKTILGILTRTHFTDRMIQTFTAYDKKKKMHQFVMKQPCTVHSSEMRTAFEHHFSTKQFLTSYYGDAGKWND